MKKLKIPLLGLLALGLLLSCAKDNIEIQKTELSEKQLLLKETSLLVGKLFTDSKIQKEVFSKMKEVDGEFPEMVSFAYLFGKENELKNNEVSAYQKKSFNHSESLFKKALRNEFTKNSNEYPSLNKLINSSKLKSEGTANDIANDLENTLTSNKLQIFYPFGEENADSEAINNYYVSYDPLVNTQTNEGYKFQNSSTNYTVQKNLSNDFIDENPVFIIAPIDDCDIPGMACKWGDGDPIGDLPPLTNSPKLLTYNVNHNLVPEKDIISSRIPAIKVNGTRWMRFGGTHLKLTFHRGSPNGTVSRVNGSLVADADSYPVKYIRIKRKYLKRKLRWVSFDAEFDPDWNMSENTQAMAVFSNHHWVGEAETEVAVKSGVKIVNGEVKPTTEATVTTKIKIKEDNSVFRTKAEMSRRFVLATIIGNGITGETRNDNGINYNVKKIDIIDYYMKFWHTDLTP